MARSCCTLGWILLVLAIVERIAMHFSPGLGAVALERNVLPHNFLELSLVFFVAGIASAQCCAKPKL